MHYTHHLYVANKWHDRINKTCPCELRSVRFDKDTITMELAGEYTLISVVEAMTGAQPEIHPFSPEIDYSFIDEGLNIEIQVFT